jgi:hypothetical protein
MDVIEPLKRLAEKATGIGIPRREEALACVREPMRVLSGVDRSSGVQNGHSARPQGQAGHPQHAPDPR